MGFQPSPNNVVRAVSILPNKTIVLGGDFTFVGNSITDQDTTNLRYRVARVTEGGIVDFGYNPGSNGNVWCSSSFLDGKVLIGGQFSVIGTTARVRMARLTASGSLDNDFVPNWSLPAGVVVASMAPQPLTGATFVGGGFGMQKLQSNGRTSPESNFVSYADTGVNVGITNLSLQANNRILLAGTFSRTSATVNNPFLERVMENGEVDPSFTSAIYGSVTTQALQPDGKILIGGDFESVGNTIRAFIARVNSNGSFDSTFLPIVNGAVRSIVLQADGKILIGGDFRSVNGALRQGVARLMPDGQLDEDFNAKLLASVYSVTGITLQGDGKIIINGGFTSVNGIGRRYIARLVNDDPEEKLWATSATGIRWMRGGTLPEAESVSFEYLKLGEWTPLGFAYRINGGWELQGFAPLPETTTIRGIARYHSGNYGASTSLQISTEVYPLPEIGMSDEAGILIPNSFIDPTAPTKAIGFGPADGSADIKLYVNNVGTGQLGNLFASVTGTNAANFTVVSQPVGPVTGPDGRTPLTLRFTPNGYGTFSAKVVVNSNDRDAPVFTVDISAQGIDPLEGWRWAYFRNRFNSGNAADEMDPDKDGQSNALEYAAGVDPTDPNSRFAMSMQMASGHAELRFSPYLDGRVYSVEKSVDLGSNSWIPVQGSMVNDGAEGVFTEGQAALGRGFYRMVVTKY